MRIEATLITGLTQLEMPAKNVSLLDELKKLSLLIKGSLSLRFKNYQNLRSYLNQKPNN